MAKFITCCPNHGAGAGHQFAAWNTCFYLAQVLGLTFVHQPIERYDDFLGFGVGEVQLTDRAWPRRVTLPPIGDVLEQIRSQCGIEWLFVEEIPTSDILRACDFVQRISQSPDDTLFELVEDDIMFDHTVTAAQVREKYWAHRATHPMASAFTDGHSLVRVAVHIRRDVVEAEQASRCLPNEWFARVLRQVIATVGRCQIEVFSEGTLFDFAAFDGVNPPDPDMLTPYAPIRFHVNADTQHVGDPMWLAFHTMASSDILICSKSGFSYLAGLVSFGHKIAPWPLWFNVPDNRDGWTRADENGIFDVDQLKNEAFR